MPEPTPSAPELSPPAAATTPVAKKRLPLWAWIAIAVAVLVVGLILSPIFAVLWFVVLVTGIVALVKNTRTWLRFPNRSVATWITAVAAVAFLITGSLANLVISGTATPDEEAAAVADVPTASATPTSTPTPTPTPTPSDVAVEVLAVIDGDTIDTSAGKVRLIGVDAPEQGAWGYTEASDALAAFLAGGSVSLVAVEGRDDEDRYGRLLRYVRVGGADAGAHLIGTGWAIARYDGRDGYGAHPLQDEYIASDAAHAMPPEPAATPAPAPAPAKPSNPAPAPAPATPATDPQFRTCGDANDNGYGNYQSGVDPEYGWYQDRDGDGWVCEF